MSTVKLNKKLCYVLRHNPASIGLSLDENGYACICELLLKLDESGVKIDKATLIKIVESDKKGRFSFNADKTKIRANYGHSFAVDLGLKPLCPPSVLYHGTAERNAESISESGLHKAQRNYVHLTEDISAAIKIGQRRGNPVVFKVDSGKMFKDGYVFYKSGGSLDGGIGGDKGGGVDSGMYINEPNRGAVWLTDNVPKEYLSLYAVSP